MLKSRWKIQSGDFPALRRRRILGQAGPNATPDVAIHPLRLVLSKFLPPVSILLEIAIVSQLGLGEYVEASIIGLVFVFNAAIGSFHVNRAQSTIAVLKARGRH